jgi:hypothetical protein
MSDYDSENVLKMKNDNLKSVSNKTVIDGTGV